MAVELGVLSAVLGAGFVLYAKHTELENTAITAEPTSALTTEVSAEKLAEIKSPPSLEH
ncbi:hypothetical protein ABH908_000019 [Pseudomonas frederiksbergensis]|uniref:hypothetical protein n=1 Tax=Pseudomonas TaxID=286 RepID=UPI003D245631